MFEEVCQILADQLNLDPAQITPDQKIKDDLGADSLDITEFNFMLEEEFDTTPEEAQTMASMETVGELCAFLAGRGV